MDVESRRDLQLLETLERESSITQRTLATRWGFALGLTNLYVKRLIRKGYVKCVTVSPNRLVYSLTPKGIVAVLERPAGTAKRLRQLGVPDDKVLMLRPDWPAPVAGQATQA